MHVTQRLPIVPQGASVFHGATQMTRVDRLAELIMVVRLKPVQLRNMADISVAGFCIPLHSPNLHPPP